MEYEVLTNIELEDYCSEKVQNLDIFQMNIANQFLDSESILSDSAQKAFEFDLLAGYLDSELEELDQFMKDLLTEISGSGRAQKINQPGDKAIDTEKSLKKLQDQVAEIKVLNSKFQRALPFGGKEPGVSDERGNSLIDERQRRHILQMLEKSIAKELDSEKKIGFLEMENTYNEEIMADIFQKFFLSDNTSVVMMETSKRLILKLQEAQFSLNCSFQREKELQLKLQEAQFNLNSSLKREKEMQSKILELKSVDEVNILKATLRESQERFALATIALKDQVNFLTKELKSSIQRAEETENRAENAETQLKLLEQVNSDLSRETDSVKKLVLLLNAEIEANSEEQDILRSSVVDMEILIGDLKKKGVEAESKCSSLVETNLKLNEEVGTMGERLGLLEGSLLRAKEANHATAMDFGIKAKIIHDLVAKLSSERDRLQAEVMVSRLTRDGTYGSAHEARDKVNFQVHEKSDNQRSQHQKANVSRMPDEFPVRTSMIEEKSDVVRSIEIQVLEPKLILSAVLVLAISAFGLYVFQVENCPF